MTSHSLHKHIIYFMNIEYQYYIVTILKANQKLCWPFNRIILFDVKTLSEDKQHSLELWHDRNAACKDEQQFKFNNNFTEALRMVNDCAVMPTTALEVIPHKNSRVYWVLVSEKIF